MALSGNAPSYHAIEAAEALARLESGRTGLSEAEALARLHRVGPNALAAVPPRPAIRILLDQLRSVVVLLLLVAAAVSLALGDLLEAAAIGVVLLINTVIGFATEIRARRAMEALLRLEVRRAVVVRDGRGREVDSRELVPGDVIELEAGASVPADARLLSATDLRVDEAPLTGESMPVDKTAGSVAAETPLPERTDMLYQGTTAVAGTASAVVVATGMETELGRIGRLLGSIADERTPLEERLDKLGRKLVWLALAAGGLVAVIGATRDAPTGQILQTGLALAIAAVPEGLPAVVTIALAVGVGRMARRRALVRRLPSVETLGSVTVVCTDKTGTLTAGEPTVTVISSIDREIAVTGSGYDLAGSFVEAERGLDASSDPLLAEALCIATLANRAVLPRAPADGPPQGDPTEAALLVAAAKAGLRREDCLAREPQIGEVPFSSERKLMATFHRRGTGELVAYVKGAPGRLLELSTRVVTRDGDIPLDPSLRRQLEEQNRGLASQGLRVLALARGRVAGADGEAALRDLTLVCFIGMTDPIAPGVKETVRVFRTARVTTVMITGDQQATAGAIARELGILDAAGRVLDGRQLGSMSDRELGEAVAKVAAFSRVSPEDKLRIVDAYQARGEIVAMLGDGVNDAAALRKADVGVAMGRRGTDVAKEAADVVLQDDRFATIGAAIEEGRVVFDNIRKFVLYLFSCNLAEILVLLLGGAFGLGLPLQPLQILWLNLVTDTFPALALALEPAEPGIMQRSPRDPRLGFFSASFLRFIAVFGLLLSAVTLAAYAIGGAGARGSPARAVTMSFATLALAQAFHLGNARSRTRVTAPREALSNPYALGAVALVVLLQVLAVHLPSLALVLDSTPLGAQDWLTVLALAGTPGVVGQLTKRRPERASD